MHYDVQAPHRAGKVCDDEGLQGEVTGRALLSFRKNCYGVCRIIEYVLRNPSQIRGALSGFS
jgi:hypothetical protein